MATRTSARPATSRMSVEMNCMESSPVFNHTSGGSREGLSCDRYSVESAISGPRRMSDVLSHIEGCGARRRAAMLHCATTVPEGSDRPCPYSRQRYSLTCRLRNPPK
jgi:hypothetical protein